MLGVLPCSSSIVALFLALFLAVGKVPGTAKDGSEV